jgi:hypothetical protein
MRSPAGRAISRAIPAVRSVPETRGQTPNRLLLKSGVQRVVPKNSERETCWKKLRLSENRTTITPSVVKTEAKAQRKRRKAITRSRNGPSYTEDENIRTELSP